MITDFPDPATDNVSSGSGLTVTHSIAEKYRTVRTTVHPGFIFQHSQEPIRRAFASDLGYFFVPVGEFVRINPVQDEQSLF